MLILVGAAAKMGDKALVDHAGVFKKLFGQSAHQLQAQGLLVQENKLVDASFVEMPRQWNLLHETATIKAGTVPREWAEQPAKRRQMDVDASWTKKNQEVHYGYKNHLKSDRLLTLIALLLFVSGCATPSIPPYNPPAQVSKTAQTVEQDGLAITVDPFFDSVRSKHYFGVDAWTSGLLVVHFQAENHANQTFLIQRKNVKLMLGDGTGRQGDLSEGPSGKSTGGEAMRVSGGVIAMLGPALAISLPLMLSGQSEMDQAQRVHRSFVDNEFRDATVSPGEKIQGFFYFQLDKNQPFPGASMIITSTTTTTHLETRIKVPITQ